MFQKINQASKLETKNSPRIFDIFKDGREVAVFIDDGSEDSPLSVGLHFHSEEEYEAFRSRLKPYSQLENYKEEH